MKNSKKKYSKILLSVAFCLYGVDVFSASNTTKQLINKYLAKYGITSNKQDCETGKEPEYIENTGTVKCKNDKQDDTNNCWDASTRLCKECPSGTVVSQKDHTTCRELKCPEGWVLVEITGDNYPAWFLKQGFPKGDSCGVDFEPYTEEDATNNYKTSYKKCKDVQRIINN